MVKLALMAYARSGKDEIYSIIRGASKEEVGRLAFGDALRKYAHEITDIATSPKPRGLYEQFGKAMRDIDKDVWVKQVDKAYQQALQEGIKNFVITDLRQPNEYKWAKENGFTVVYVYCDEAIRKERSQGDTNWVAINPSETDMVNLVPDLMIWNEGSLDELINITKCLLKEVQE